MFIALSESIFHVFFHVAGINGGRGLRRKGTLFRAYPNGKHYPVLKYFCLFLFKHFLGRFLNH